MILEKTRQVFLEVCLLLLCLWATANSEICSGGELCTANELKQLSSTDVAVFGQANEVSLLQMSAIEKRVQESEAQAGDNAVQNLDGTVKNKPKNLDVSREKDLSIEKPKHISKETKKDVSGATLKDASEETPTGQSRRKIAVCIAGQLSRLEISSKRENVLKPLGRDHLVHVFLALEDGGARYVNNYTAGTCGAPAAGDVLKGLQPFYQSASFHPQYGFTPNVSRWSRSNYLHDKPRIKLSEQLKQDRLAGHMAQWSNLKKCAELITTRESQLGIRYDLVLKLRDNTLAVQPFDLPTSADCAMLSKECNSWGGISDKVMLVPRAYLDPCLTGMYSVLFGVEQGDPKMTFFVESHWVKNPEKMLMETLKMHNVPMKQVSEAVLPFVDARCDSSDGKRVWCPVEGHKDCWPPSPWKFHLSEDCKYK